MGHVSFVRADFTGAQPLPSPYTSVTQVYNNNGVFQPMPTQMNFRPLAAAAVPGVSNILGIARQNGGVDLYDASNGSTTKLLQIPIAPYPFFAPEYNMVTVPGGLTPVPGVLYAQGESGLLGLAFHPNYSAPVGTTGRRKFYVNATTYNPGIFLPGNPTDGITHESGEPGEINDELDAINASPQLEQCFICDHQGDDLFAFVGPTGRMGFGCLTPAFKDASALNRTFTEIREYTVNEEGTDVVKDGLGNPEFRTIMPLSKTSRLSQWGYDSLRDGWQTLHLQR